MKWKTDSMTFQAPAKINLCLHVLGRREDGYHELAMAMQRVSLFDEVTIRLSHSAGVGVRCDGVNLSAGEENIAARAARLFLEYVEVGCGVDIEITKRIPVAAGLGGGSSDAATVLVGLNRMLDGGLSVSELQVIGAKIGSDVPFFIYEDFAWATGTGTDLQPLKSVADIAYLLVNPGFAVSTAAVYQSLQLTKGGQLANLPRFSVTTREGLCGALHNDLERVVFASYPEVAEIKQALVEHGAMGALMSGSGATVFGIFANLAAAACVGEKMAQERLWTVFPVLPL